MDSQPLIAQTSPAAKATAWWLDWNNLLTHGELYAPKVIGALVLLFAAWVVSLLASKSHQSFIERSFPKWVFFAYILSPALVSLPNRGDFYPRSLLQIAAIFQELS